MIHCPNIPFQCPKLKNSYRNFRYFGIFLVKRHALRRLFKTANFKNPKIASKYALSCKNALKSNFTTRKILLAYLKIRRASPHFSIGCLGRLKSVNRMTWMRNYFQITRDELSICNSKETPEKSENLINETDFILRIYHILMVDFWWRFGRDYLVGRWETFRSSHWKNWFALDRARCCINGLLKTF